MTATRVMWRAGARSALQRIFSASPGPLQAPVPGDVESRCDGLRGMSPRSMRGGDALLDGQGGGLGSRLAYELEVTKQ